MNLINPPLGEGRPPVVPRPTRWDPHPLVAWPGWEWWYGKHGRLHARHGVTRVEGHNFVVLLERIRKAEGKRDE